MVFGNGDNVNCVVIVQINEQGFAVTNQQVKQGLWALADSCRPLQLGGSAVSTNGKWAISAVSNEDYQGTSDIARRSLNAAQGYVNKASIVPRVNSLKMRADGVSIVF